MHEQLQVLGRRAWSVCDVFGILRRSWKFCVASARVCVIRRRYTILLSPVVYINVTVQQMNDLEILLEEVRARSDSVTWIPTRLCHEQVLHSGTDRCSDEVLGVHDLTGPKTSHNSPLR